MKSNLPKPLYLTILLIGFKGWILLIMLGILIIEIQGQTAHLISS